MWHVIRVPGRPGARAFEKRQPKRYSIIMRGGNGLWEWYVTYHVREGCVRPFEGYVPTIREAMQAADAIRFDSPPYGPPRDDDWRFDPPPEGDFTPSGGGELVTA